MADALIWKEITTAYAVEDAMVIVRTPYGEKAAQLVGTNAIWIAARLLRELAAEGKA